MVIARRGRNRQSRDRSRRGRGLQSRWGPSAATLVGAGAGLALDRWLGEPPVEPHPVAAFGSAMTGLERRWWADDVAAGRRYAAAGIAIGAATGIALGPGVGAVATATWLATAGRMLGETAQGIGAHLRDGDLNAARAALPSLVGRDPAGLDEAEIARAVVESVAENTVDAVVAPAWWAAVAGAPGVLAHRAINTMDAMVGHHSDRYERFGRASARVDDAANWVPARLTAALVVAARPAHARAVWAAVRRDAPDHPSPNAGVAEAAFAAALGVRLGGANRYGERVEHRAGLGDGRPPTGADIDAAVALLGDVTRLLSTVLVVKGAALGAVSFAARRATRRAGSR